MPAASSYPFRPRSTASLQPGHLWAIPLADGRYACGRVLQLGLPRIPTPTRAFYGGLHAWVGAEPPTANDLAGVPILHAGVMHLRAITETGGVILDWRALTASDPVLPAQLSQYGGEGTMLLAGAADVRPATREEWGVVPTLGYWGYDFIRVLAEKWAAGIQGAAP